MAHELKISMDGQLFESGHAPAQLLVMNRSEEPEALVSRLRGRKDLSVVEVGDSGGLHLKLNEGVRAAGEELETALAGQTAEPFSGVYGHPFPMGAFQSPDPQPILIVGGLVGKDSRRVSAVNDALRAPVTVMAVENAHAHMVAGIPDMWIAGRLDDGGTTDCMMIERGDCLAMVPVEDCAVKLYDAVTGEYSDRAAEDCPNVLLYDPVSVPHEEFCETFLGVSDFGTGFGEVTALTAAVHMGYREIAVIGFPADPILTALCEKLAMKDVRVVTLDHPDSSHPTGMSCADYRRWLEFLAVSTKSPKDLSAQYLRQSRHGGMLLRPRHVLEKYDELAKAFPEFSTMLVRDEIKKARESLEDPHGCRDCELKKLLAITMSRFHSTFHERREEFEDLWKELFPGKTYYVYGGKTYGRRPDNAV